MDLNLILLCIAFCLWVFPIGMTVFHIFRKPKIISEVSGDVLILAAHQDDCVILAGDFAIEASQVGRQIDIVYLTCGDTSKGTQKSESRNQEAKIVWGSLGVSPEHLHFLGLPQSELGGQLLMSTADFESAKGKLELLLSKLSYGTSIFIPAAGESHCDHRALRQMALEALNKVGRHDLMVFEAAEYNNYYSFRHCPIRSFLFCVQNTPFIRRWSSSRYDWKHAGFITGSTIHWMLPSNQIRLEKKRELLRKFVSEDGELLVKYFGYPDRYRMINDINIKSLNSEKKGFYFLIGSDFIAPSLLMFWVGIWGMLGLVSIIMIESFDYFFSSIAIFSGATLAVFLIRKIIKTTSIFSRYAQSAILIGIIAGMCLSY